MGADGTAGSERSGLCGPPFASLRLGPAEGSMQRHRSGPCRRVCPLGAQRGDDGGEVGPQWFQQLPRQRLELYVAVLEVSDCFRLFLQ